MSTKQPIWPSGRFGVPQITPFTYRDGHTHMELIEALREHLVERLHPSLVSTVNSLVVQMEAEYGKALDQYVNGVEEFQRIHDAFMADVNGSLTALNDSAVADLIEDNTSLLGERLRDLFTTRDEQPIIADTVLLTVGEGGNYDTLNEALERASRFNTLYRNKGIAVEIRLMSNFVMREQVAVEQLDLGFVTITSEDASVPIHTAELAQHVTSRYRGVFTGYNNATLPIIDTIFIFDDSATGTIHGVALNFNSSIVVTGGVINAPDRGMDIQQNSSAVLLGANFSNAGGVGIRVATGSSVQCEVTIATNCMIGLSVTSGRATAHRADFSGGQFGVSSQSGGVVSAHDVNVSGCSEIGAESRMNATLNIPRVNAKNCGIGVYVSDGSTANLKGGVVDGSGIGVHAEHGSHVNGEDLSAQSCDNQGVLLQDASTGNLENLVATSCDVGVQVENGSRGNVFAADVGHSTQAGFRVYYGAHLAAWYARANDCARGLSAVGGSTVMADNTTLSGARVDGSVVSLQDANVQRGSSSDNEDLVVRWGSTVNARNMVGGTTQTPNELTVHGVVYQ